MGRILVVRGGAIGDFVLTLPAIQLIRESLPNPHISVLGYRNIVDVALEFGIVDEARSIEYGALAKFFAPGAELDRELMRWFGSFDLVVSYLYDPDGYFAENVERCGVETFLQGIHKVEDDPAAGHAARQLARPLERLAMFLENPAPTLDFETGGAAGESRLLAGIEADVPLIAIHPGSGSPRKNWPLEHWVETCLQLNQARGSGRFVVVTGEAEGESGSEFSRRLRAAGLNVTRWHAEPLPDLALALRKCVLFLGHDSGISHLAAACGTRSVLVFGPTSADIWAPQNPGVTVVASVSGQMDGVPPGAVTAAAVDALSES